MWKQLLPGWENGNPASLQSVIIALANSMSTMRAKCELFF
jgi:hypothetical protein